MADFDKEELREPLIERVGHKVNTACALGLDEIFYQSKPKEYQAESGG